MIFMALLIYDELNVSKLNSTGKVVSSESRTKVIDLGTVYPFFTYRQLEGSLVLAHFLTTN